MAQSRTLARLTKHHKYHPSNERVDHDVLERVRRLGLELVLEPHDLVVELVLVFLANNQLERFHQVRGVGQRHAAAGHVDDQATSRNGFLFKPPR